ncbi:MAG: penicillin acylase family protein [Spirochaetales bacterium]|nr:penicillin acylase family protein [Spirochaetales bacterium]
MKKRIFQLTLCVFIIINFINVVIWSENCYPGTKVRRDANGVWFIESRSFYGAFEAMGYCIAEDRLWQLETFRRAAKGRLAEIFGPDFIEVDVFMRTIGYSEEEMQTGYRELGRGEKIMIRAYVNGINRRITEVVQNPALLPFEFHAIGNLTGQTFIPDYWSVTDILATGVSIMRQFDPETLQTGQIDNAVLLQELAQKYPTEFYAMFNDLRWMNDPLAQTMIPEEEGKKKEIFKWLDPVHYKDIRKTRDKIKKNIDSMKKKLKRINSCLKLGSYAAVLAGKKTTTGNPILYSGPQMGFSTPSLVCEGSIKAPGYIISGMCIPGLPGFPLGRTPYHAWSLQAGHAHTVDYYLEEPSSIFLHRVEIIKVAGAEDFPLPVYRSQHGPVIHPMPYNPDAPGDMIVTWKSAHWKFNLNFQTGILRLGTSRSIHDFNKAVHKLPISAHICYADRKGNIAYWMSGRNPVRPEGIDPRLPLLGDGSQEWPEPVKYIPMPFAMNPEQGYFGGWNNKPTVDYDHGINYMNELIHGVFHRAHVVEEYLTQKKRYSYNDMLTFAKYISSTDSIGVGGNPWKFVKTLFTGAVMNHPEEDRLKAIDLLNEWDGFLFEGGPDTIASATVRSDGWVLQNAWITEVLRLVFDDELKSWADQPLSLLFNVFLHGVMNDESGIINQYNWFQDRSGTGKPTDVDQLIVLALDNTLAQLGPCPWNIPRGEIVYTHDLLGPLTSTPYSNRGTYAQCIEMGRRGPVRIESMFPLGQSGTILLDFETGAPVFDPNFFSMKPYFDTYTHRPFPLF